MESSLSIMLNRLQILKLRISILIREFLDVSLAIGIQAICGAVSTAVAQILLVCYNYKEQIKHLTSLQARTLFKLFLDMDATLLLLRIELIFTQYL